MLKLGKAASAAVVCLAIILVAETALARGGRGGSHSGGRHSGSSAHTGSGQHASGGAARTAPRVRHFVPVPIRLGAIFPAYWYYSPPLYSSSAVVLPYVPLDYIEKGPERASPESYWYYCPEEKTYYPYIEQCPGGWQAVVPGPSAP